MSGYLMKVKPPSHSMHYKKLDFKPRKVEFYKNAATGQTLSRVYEKRSSTLDV